MAEKVNVMFSEEEVDKRIKELGEQISKDYEGKQVHLVCVLKGGSFFMCELAKRITVPVSLDFMSVSSYGSETKSSGVVKIVKDLDDSIQGKDVLVVEDIVDSGRTLSYLLDMLNDRKPASLKLPQSVLPIFGKDAEIVDGTRENTIGLAVHQKLFAVICKNTHEVDLLCLFDFIIRGGREFVKEKMRGRV